MLIRYLDLWAESSAARIESKCDSVSERLVCTDLLQSLPTRA